MKLVSLLVAYLLIIPVCVHSQCMQYDVGVDYVIEESDLIVEGKVIHSQSYLHSLRQNTYTIHTIDVYKVLKGTIEKDQVKVVTKGGRVGNFEEQVTPEVDLARGIIGTFLLKASAADPTVEYLMSELPTEVYTAWTIDQSVYLYNQHTKKAISAFHEYDLQGNDLVDYIDNKVGQEIDYKKSWSVTKWLRQWKQADSRMISSFSPTTTVAGVNNTITISGTGFGSTMGEVGFTWADNPSFFFYIDQDYITNWSNTSITCIVPASAATGRVRVQTSTGTNYVSGADITVSYAITSYNDPNKVQDDFVRFVSPNTAGDFEYRLNTNFANNTAAAASFNRAVNSWKCGTDIHWIQGANTTTSTASSDDESVITFATLNAGTLGVQSTYFFWCTANPTDRFCDEIDIRFSNSASWEYGPGLPSGSESDFESVALHELGHALQLGHVNDTDEVMHFQISGGETQREVDGVALAAGLFMIPKHQGGGITCSGFHPLTANPPLLVTNTGSSGAGSFSQALLDVCDGQAVAFSGSLSGATLSIIGGQPWTIDKDMTIQGLGAASLTLSGSNSNRIFTISPDVEFTLEDIRLINGNAPFNGGAFYNQGTTILRNVILENNTQSGVDKAFSNQPGKEVIMEGDVDIRE